MVKKPEAHIKTIDKLVKMSFGKVFSGRYVIFPGEFRRYSMKGAYLDTIAKRVFPFIPKLNEKYEVVGVFNSPDGSKLNITHPEYAQNGERYGTLYSLQFKRSAWINGKEISVKAGKENEQ